MYTLIIFVFLTNFEGILSVKCVENSHTKTKVFDSLISYQSNKIPFDSEGMGNYVSFKQNIDTLPVNSFITFDSEHVMKLNLDNKNISKVWDGTFNSLTCLRYLTMKNNSLTEFTWKTFDGLENLRELELSRNKLKELPDLLFKNLVNMRYLDLSNNLILKLNILTFTNLSGLQTLNLSENKLNYIEKEVFDPLLNLEVLDVSFNKFTSLESHQWMLPSLDNLSFAGNYLRSFDMNNNYSFVNLKYLNLSSNYLTTLNVHGLKRTFRSLTVLDLNQNDWQCHELSRILHYLSDLRLQIPERNKSELTISGIDCYNEKSDIISHFELDTTTFTSNVKSTTMKEFNSNKTNEKIRNQIDRLAVKNNEILVEISGIRKLLIFSLLFFVILVIIFASIQVGLCDSIKRKIYGREGYLDTNIQENYVMFRS